MDVALTMLHGAILFNAAAIFVAAAVMDGRSYRIPNGLCVALLVLFLAYVLTSRGTTNWPQHLIVFGIVAAAGFALFVGRIMGAGDAKLLAVASLWAGVHLVPLLLLITAFAGGVEAIVMSLAVSIKKPGPVAELRKVKIPYGIAIATGGLAVLGMMAQPLLYKHADEVRQSALLRSLCASPAAGRSSSSKLITTLVQRATGSSQPLVTQFESLQAPVGIAAGMRGTYGNA